MAAWRISVLVLLLCVAQPAFARGSKVVLQAPKAVRALLDEHFVLPDTVLREDSERAAFMRRARREIPELLATEGFFSASVKLSKITRAGVLEVEVDSGPRTRVSAVEIELRGDLQSDPARAEALRASWLLPPGKAFRAADWERAKTELLALLAREDFAAARLVSSDAEVDVAAAGARLRVVLDSGTRYVFGALQIDGLQRYDPKLVRHRATFRQGAPYRRALLLEYQAALQKLPQFSSVVMRLDTATAVPAADGRLQAPVSVQIVEAQSRKLSFGIGYSTNNGVRNEVNYQSYNFLDRAWILNGAVSAEHNRQNLNVGLNTPPNAAGYGLSWRAGVEKTQVQGLRTRRDKLGVTRSRSTGKIEIGTSLDWQQEQRRPRGGIPETDQALVIDWHWHRRAVDDPLAPSDGGLTEFRVGGSSKAVVSDRDFVRGYGRHQSWFPLTGNDVLSLRAEAGYTAAKTRLGIPQEYLFRVGGTQTVRGFAFQSLGFVEGGAVVGGRVMSTFSAEATHWFGNWGVAAFTDAGGAADTLSALKLFTSYGFGPRWKSPVGPLALDWARGEGEPSPRLHFAIAVAF